MGNYTMQHHSTAKRNELLVHITTRTYSKASGKWESQKSKTANHDLYNIPESLESPDVRGEDRLGRNRREERGDGHVLTCLWWTNHTPHQGQQNHSRE